eukprot:scaffold2862_cov458-Pavlova_lutheri.AAC.1
MHHWNWSHELSRLVHLCAAHRMTLSGSIERPGSRDPPVGVSSPNREESLSCRQTGTMVPNGPVGSGLSIGRTNATSDT